MTAYWIVVPAEQLERAKEVVSNLKPSVVMGVLDGLLDDMSPCISDTSFYEGLGIFRCAISATKNKAWFILQGNLHDALTAAGIAHNMRSNMNRAGARFDYMGNLFQYKANSIDPTYKEVVAQNLELTTYADRKASEELIATICMWDDWHGQPSHGRVYRTMKMIGAT